MLVGLLACSASGPAPGAPLPGRLAGGKPEGLFFFMDVFNRQAIYYFTPDGRVYEEPASFTPAGLAAVVPKERGAVEVNGEEMTVKWDEGAPETHRYKYDATGFEWNGSFVRVGPFASAKQLAGTFEGHNDAIATDANELTSYRTLVLQPDGSFTRDTYAAAHLEASTGITTDVASAADQAGHWTLDGWFLTLTDGHGTVRDIAFPTATDDKSGQTQYFRFHGTSYRNASH